MNYGNFYWVSDQQEMYEDKVNYLPAIKAHSQTAEAIGLDIETTGIDLYIDRILTIQIALFSPPKYLPVIFVIDWVTANKETQELIRYIIQELPIPKIGHNLKFDYKFLKHLANIQINQIWDTFIVEKILTSGSNQKLNLAEVTYKYAEITLNKSIRDEFFEKQERLNLKKINKDYAKTEIKKQVIDLKKKQIQSKKLQKVEVTDKMKKYAADDVRYLHLIRHRQEEAIEKLNKSLNINLKRVCNLENTLVPIYGDIELKGIKLDTIKWKANIIHLKKEIEHREEILISTIKELKETPIKDKEQTKKEFIDDYIETQILINHTEIDKPNNFKLKEYRTEAEVKWEKEQQFKDEPFAKKKKPFLTSNIQQNLFETKPSIISTIKLNSNKDILELLNDLGLNPQLRNKFSGELTDSSSHAALEQYVSIGADGLYVNNREDKLFDIYPAILNYRNALKAYNTYGETFINKYLNEETQRIHPSFKQVGTDTGRVACTEPNMQNIPSDSEFRSCFIAEPGYKLITADYSQAEIRIVAEITNETNLINALNKGEDPYGTIGTKMFKVPVSKKENKHLRDISKIILLGLNYGMEAGQLSNKLNCSKETAREYIEIFQKEFPNLHWGLYRLGEAAERTGYSLSMNPFTRIRWYVNLLDIKRLEEEEANMPPPKNPDVIHSEQALKQRERIHKDRKAVRESTKRAGKNMPIQGTNADLTKLATYFIHKHIVDNNLDAAIINQVHDEIVIEAKEEIAESLAKVIEQLMLKAGTYILKKLKTPIEYHIDNCWSK